MTASRIGYVIYERNQRPDALLRLAADRLTAAGVRVGGLLQDGQESDGSCCATMFAEDIGTGRRVQIYEDRGPGTRGCRLDPAGLAEAAGWLREAIDARPDVVFVNRYGRQEALGRGLLDEIAAAVVAEIPLVIAVSQALLPEWLTYVGEDAVPLLPEPGEIEAWCTAHSGTPMPA